MSTVKPFDVTYKLMNVRSKVIDVVSFDEPFILVTEIHCLSPWKLYIHSSNLDLVDISFSLTLPPYSSVFLPFSVHLQPPNVKNIGINSSQIKGCE